MTTPRKQISLSTLIKVLFTIAVCFFFGIFGVGAVVSLVSGGLLGLSGWITVTGLPWLAIPLFLLALYLLAALFRLGPGRSSESSRS